MQQTSVLTAALLYTNKNTSWVRRACMAIRSVILIVAIMILVILSNKDAIAQSNHNLPKLGDASALVLSPAEETVLGQLYFNNLSSQLPLVTDSLSLAYINDLGARLSNQVENHGLKFQFFIVKDHRINAFAGPGGYIGINSGLIETSNSESELAAVIAHEIAHVTQRHIARSMAYAKSLKLPILAGSLAAIALGVGGHGNAANAGLLGSKSIGSNMMLSFNQAEETEADQIGIRILYDAGFDPKAMATFMQKMQASKQEYRHQYFNLSNHPAVTERLAEVENRAANLPWHGQTNSSSDYNLFKARLQSLYLPLRGNTGQLKLQQATERSLKLAANEFQQNIQINDNNKINYADDYASAILLLRNGNTKNAKTIINHLNSSPYNNLWEQLLHNQLLAAQGDNSAQLQQLQNLYKIYPDYKPVAISLINSLIHYKKYSPAIEVLQQQIIYHPQQAIWYLMLAECYNKKKEFIDATINQSKGFLNQYRAKIAYARLKQLKNNYQLKQMEKQEINGLLNRAKLQIDYINTMLSSGIR